MTALRTWAKGRARPATTPPSGAEDPEDRGVSGPTKIEPGASHRPDAEDHARGSVRQRTLELERTPEQLRRSQQQVIQQERLAALGTMAGGIAHDFNNALSVIMGFGEILLRDSQQGLTREAAAPFISTILTAAEDAAKILRRLREFHRPGEADEQRLPVDLNQLVE